MKIAPRDGEKFCRAPRDDVFMVLLYGPDQGLAGERAVSLVAAVCAGGEEAFLLSDLDPKTLRDEPASLMDEFKAGAMFGGRRVVRVREGNNALSPRLAMLLDEAMPGDALVIVQAGELAPRDGLRKLAEQHAKAAAIACYLDEGRGLEELIQGHLRSAGLNVEPAAIAALCQILGQNRQLTRSELDKLVLYKGSDGLPVSEGDVRAVIAGAGAFDAQDIALAAFSGHQSGLDLALTTALAARLNPVAILSASLRHGHRLHLAASEVAGGRTAEAALKALRPPVFFKEKPVFMDQLRHWSDVRLARALSLLAEADRDCKRTGYPVESICRRALIRIAAAARR